MIVHTAGDQLSTILAWLARYQERGWTLTQLHGVDGTGRCTCGREDREHRKQAGKHPTQLAWQSHGMSRWEDVEQAWRAFPGGNVGVVTGRPSGVWVLDIDPDNGGDLALSALEAAHGPLPPTYTVRTGSGGRHLYWLMPEDGSDITNARGALPPGIDVRGTGGQVVAPPSRSGIGPYDELVLMPPVPAPGWLLATIRARAERPTAPAGEYQAELVDQGDPATAEARRARSYATAAARAELAMIGSAREGTRNSTAFASACSLHELINAPWSGLTIDVIWPEYMRAIAVCGLPEQEAADVWGKAGARVGGRAREYPELPALAFQGGLEIPTQRSGSPLTLEGQVSQVTTVTVDGQLVSPVDEFLSRLLTSEMLDTVPELELLVDGYLFMDTLTWIIGKPGEGKSFVALDLALSIATGRPWHGREVNQGSALYIVAEGARGMRARVRAWERHNYSGAHVRNVFFYPMPVQAGDPAAWSVLVEASRRLQPAYIVVDTQARTTVGLKENDNTEMGIFIERCEQLRAASGGCVTLVHHVNSAGTARGASALFGSAQTELSVSRHDTELTVTMTKQKDAPELEPLLLTMTSVELPEPLGTSVVLTSRSGPSLEQQAALLALEADSRSAALQCLVGLFADVFAEGRGGTKAEVKGQFMVAYSRMAPQVATVKARERAFYRAWNQATDKGMIARVTGTQSWRWVSASEREP